MAPFGGYCSVTPKSGRLQHDVFTLLCSGWQDYDEDDRLMYKFSYRTKPSGAKYLLQYTTKNTISPVLFPLGNKEWNYPLEITVEIINRYGASSKFLLSVEVSFDVPVKRFRNEVYFMLLVSIGSVCICFFSHCFCVGFRLTKSPALC